MKFNILKCQVLRMHHKQAFYEMFYFLCDHVLSQADQAIKIHGSHKFRWPGPQNPYVTDPWMRPRRIPTGN